MRACDGAPSVRSKHSRRWIEGASSASLRARIQRASARAPGMRGRK
jgi:hypothetical protein